MATKTLRNPNFNKHHRQQLSWTRVIRGHFPDRHHTVCCPDLARVDDIVITIPIIRNGKTDVVAVVHQRCMATFFATVPDDRTIISRKAAAIIGRFRKVNDEEDT